MQTTTAEYQRRFDEISEYISYLELLENTTGPSVTLMSTMKASALLMLYNLVESTMTNTVQAVFDHIKTHRVGLDGLTDDVKIFVIGNVKRRNAKSLVEKMKTDKVDLSIASFDRADVFSGNLDGKKIRETLKELGVNTTTSNNQPVLLTIKKSRNDLAHGKMSFADAGKNITTSDLKTHLRKVGLLLTSVIKDFTTYVNNKDYA